MKIRVFTAFSGYDSQFLALDHIFRKMFVETESENRQLEFF